MRIAITGATSFIGVHLIESCISAGLDIVAIIRKDSGKRRLLENNNKIRIIEAQMEAYASIGNLTDKVDCLVHLAWNGTRGADRSDEKLQFANYINSLNLIYGTLRSGCPKIILAGSQAEYGACNGIINEETVSSPNTPYGKYKLKLYEEASRMCAMYGADLLEPRIFSVYGCGDNPGTLIMSVIERMSKNEPCNLTECIQQWDFLYVKDAADALCKMILAACPSGIYNLGSGDVRPLREYIEELRAVLKSSSQLNYGAIPYPRTGMVSIAPDISKLMTTLNWKPQYSFKKGINDLIRDCRIWFN